ncbi:MAG: type III-B CRISPR module RAMP protein Cmr6 [Streptosporangiaceae bacterium]
MIQAAGPIGAVIESDGTAVKGRVGFRLGADANALIMLHRLAFPSYTPGGGIGMDEAAGRALLRWASDSGLGQEMKLVRQVAARRRQARAALRSARQKVARLRAEPEWRLAVGLGNRANAHEIGLSLHGTYGWPVIPGSSLKGLAAAWALESKAKAEDMARIFGAPRPGGADGERKPASAGRGSVRFLDAIPDGARVTVAVDVLTPHVKPYYDATAADSRKPLPPPGEYHSPVPVSFLTVSGAFSVDLYGPEDCDDVDLAAQWLTEAGSELGAGAKTAAGYGYLKLTRLPDDEGTR